MITVPIHEGEARVRGQLAYDNPDVAKEVVAGALLKRHLAGFNLLERATVGVLLNNCPAVLTGVDLMNLLLLSAEHSQK